MTEATNKLRALAEARLASVNEAIGQLMNQKAQIESQVNQLQAEFQDGLQALQAYDEDNKDE